MCRISFGAHRQSHAPRLQRVGAGLEEDEDEEAFAPGPSQVRVDHGAALDGSTDRGTQITVIDYVDDGRYLIREGERIEAMPIDTGRLCTEIDGMIAFYKTPAGQAVIKKMPALMQQIMAEMPAMMGPLMQKMQPLAQQLAADLKAAADAPATGQK